MRKETSAGGVVLFKNTILLLRRFNNDWVLPKGRMEKDETLEETAIREVFEESGIKANIITYVGHVNYTYRSLIDEMVVDKDVHWFLMRANNTNTSPQRDEGFKDAVFVQKYNVLDLLKYKDERDIVEKALLNID